MLLTDTFIDLFYFTEVNSAYDFNQFKYTVLRKKYEDLIYTSEKMALAGNIPAEVWRKAFFAVAVWIDETILLSGWSDRMLWCKDALQRTYFKTSNGGVEFFTALEQLDSKENQIREIFDLCLSLGFKGTYYRESDVNTRQKIVNKTIEVLKADRSMELPGILFPCAYRGDAKLNFEIEKDNRLLFLILLIIAPVIVFVVLYLFFTASLSSIATELTKHILGNF